MDPEVLPGRDHRGGPERGASEGMMPMWKRVCGDHRGFKPAPTGSAAVDRVERRARTIGKTQQEPQGSGGEPAESPAVAAPGQGNRKHGQ